MTEKGASEHRGEREREVERENICTCSSQMLGNGLQPFSHATVGLRQDSLSFYASLGNSGKLLTLRLHRPGSKMIDVSMVTEKRERYAGKMTEASSLQRRQQTRINNTAKLST